MLKTTIVLPTYNEIENLEDMVNALLSLNVVNLSILIVDDNSPDGTGRLADKLVSTYNNVSVLHRHTKAGLGPAYLAGFTKALEMGADYIVQMDTDFSHNPKYIPTMLKTIEKCDLVIGSRYIKGGGVDNRWSLYRKLLSWWANRIYTHFILGFPVYDATAGYRLWKAETLRAINFDKIHSSGYVFQIEMAYTTYKNGLKIIEVPIYFPDRAKGKSKMKSRIVLEAAIKVWGIKFRSLFFGTVKM
ncbi:MAG: polyprenol monophosphomannose synthase [Patescibacteria group bacterium]|nr:polyprenol monophosphomannose synthase [Patescibacteria group bacterium]MBU1952754.1 polyprenol monophosphomannose synthase [Patescibacteria group bacterium]